MRNIIIMTDFIFFRYAEFDQVSLESQFSASSVKDNLFKMPAEKHEHEHDHHSKESSAKLVTSHYGRNRRQPDHKERKIDGRRRSEQLTGHWDIIVLNKG